MSHHNREFPRQAELNQSLKDHGLEVKKPSQLSDAFRFGWRAMFELSDAAPVAAQPPEPTAEPAAQEDIRRLVYALCEDVQNKSNDDSDFDRGMRTAARRIANEVGAVAQPVHVLLEFVEGIARDPDEHHELREKARAVLEQYGAK